MGKKLARSHQEDSGLFAGIALRCDEAEALVSKDHARDKTPRRGME
jgi:hypothetical protein